MLIRPSECRGCPLDSIASGFSVPDGTCSNKVLILGEALGADEVKEGLPFVGQAGTQLNRTIYRGNLKREDFGIWNAVACRPPDNFLEGAPYEDAAVQHCDVHFQKVIRAFQPKVIVPTGNVALNKLIGRKGIKQARGYVYDVDLPLGDEGYSCWVVPTLHLSFVMHGNMNYMGVQLFDLRKALKTATSGPLDYKPHYIQYPSEEDAMHFLREASEAISNEECWLTADIETPGSGKLPEDEYDSIHEAEIIRVSFAFKPGYAITIPWTASFLPIIQEFFLLPTPYIVFWNYRFDVPRLRDKGIVIRAPILDAMMMWHFYQSDLPKFLGFVSTFFTDMREWKSLAESNPTFYSCCDADAQITNTYALRDRLSLERRLPRFLRHWVELEPVLQIMTAGGVSVDREKQAEFRAELDGNLDKMKEGIQQVVPDEVAPFHELTQLKIEVQCLRCRGSGMEPDKVKLKAAKLSIKALSSIDIDSYKEKYASPEKCSKCEGEGIVNETLKAADSDAEELRGYTRVQTAKGWRWHKRLPFLPTSSQQVQAYILWKGHPLSKDHKTKKPTTAKLDIDHLAKSYPRDPLYNRIVEYRETQKIIGQYIDGYEPGPDGRIHTTFTQNPSTWRLASQSPNMQNVTKRLSYSNRVRETFVPAPGHVLVEADYSAIEALMVGFYAADQDYIRASRLGIHAILASYVLTEKKKWQEPIDLRWSEDEIKEAVSEIKRRFESVYDDCKHVVHGSNFLGTPFKIKMEFPESFSTLKYAEELQALYFSTIARKVRRWQHNELDQASTRGYSDSAFQYRHYWWDVYYKTSRGERMVWDDRLGNWIKVGRRHQWFKSGPIGEVWGQQAKEVIAFKPQNSAAAITKDVMLELSMREVYLRAMRLQGHDSLIFEFPADKMLDTRISNVVDVMRYPVNELGGLRVGVEVKVFRDNWAKGESWPS